MISGHTSDAGTVAEAPILYIVACGARPAVQTARSVGIAHDADFDAHVIATPTALEFIGETAQLERLTGHPVSACFVSPGEPDPLPLADAILVSPLTFNTLNKWAAGISDTLAAALLNEALGLGVPITAVPWLNAQLARHPAAAGGMQLLRSAGVRFTSGFGHPSTRIPGPDGRIGAPVYPWDEVEDAITGMRGRVAQGAGSPRAR